MSEHKRWRVPVPKPGHLLALYGRTDRFNSPDLVYVYPNRNIKCDSRVLMHALEEVPVYDGKSLREELEARGYDITTLKFSIKLKDPRP